LLYWSSVKANIDGAVMLKKGKILKKEKILKEGKDT